MALVQALGEEPKTLLIRRKKILTWLGISGIEFDKLVCAGLVPYKTFGKNKKRWFRTADIKKVFVEDYK